tara:strand:+ start:125 stop:253 length:129 start_codon:yes stop_codon:yes gene_type:complete
MIVKEKNVIDRSSIACCLKENRIKDFIKFYFETTGLKFGKKT